MSDLGGIPLRDLFARQMRRSSLGRGPTRVFKGPVKPVTNQRLHGPVEERSYTQKPRYLQKKDYRRQDPRVPTNGTVLAVITSRRQLRIKEVVGLRVDKFKNKTIFRLQEN